MNSMILEIDFRDRYDNIVEKPSSYSQFIVDLNKSSQHKLNVFLVESSEDLVILHWEKTEKL